MSKHEDRYSKVWLKRTVFKRKEDNFLLDLDSEPYDTLVAVSITHVGKELRLLVISVDKKAINGDCLSLRRENSVQDGTFVCSRFLQGVVFEVQVNDHLGIIEPSTKVR